MTLGTLLLMVVTVYLVLIAYGVVRARRRLAGRAKLVAEALLVVVPPMLMAGALVGADEGALVAAWWRLFVSMTMAGVCVAAVAEQVARRVEP